jgi:hypothetical protein
MNYRSRELLLAHIKSIMYFCSPTIVDSEKSTAGGKCDYHTLGACRDVLQVLQK